MTRLQDNTKWGIIQEWERSGNIAAAARMHRVTWITAQRWVKCYIATSNVLHHKPTGRKPSISAAVAKTAVELACSGQHGGAASVAKELHSLGLTERVLHGTTIMRHAKKQAKLDGTPLRLARGMPVKMLTDATKLKRLAFCRANRGKDWSRVLFTDRAKFHFRYPGVSVRRQQWLKRGQKMAACSVNHPQCVNVYAGISKHGVTACHIVTGTSKHKSPYINKKGATAKNITSAEYADVVKHTFLQQDNDPTHRVAPAIVNEWSKQHSATVTVLPNWPPNSPDLNLIENCWSFVQARVNEQGCKTFAQFKKAVLFEITHIPKSMLGNLFNSMPKRVAKVIDLEGDKLSC